MIKLFGKGKVQKIEIINGFLLFVDNGVDIDVDVMVVQIVVGVVKKSVEKVIKDVICDLVGQVCYEEVIQFCEVIDCQGNIIFKVQCFGWMWVFFGDVYNLLFNVQFVVGSEIQVIEGQVLVEVSQCSEYGGEVCL